MQYLVSVIDDTTGSATSNEMADIDAFNDRLRAEGHWVFAAGLGSPSTATVIDNRNGVPVFTDGPFGDLDIAEEAAAEAFATAVARWPSRHRVGSGARRS